MFIFLSMWLNPAAKVVDKFINALNDSLQTSPNDYIIWELQNDPFLSLLMDQDIILNHKTIKINKDGRNRLKVNSSLSTKSGSINVWFDLAKIDNKWLITKLPKTTYIEAGVPLKIQKKDKELFEYQIDVSGTHIYSKLSSPESSMNIGIPASLILVGDYIVEYQHLIPLHLNRIMSTSAQHIEDALMGNIPIDGSFNIYTMSEDIPTHLEDNIIPMGISNVTLYSSASHKNKSLVAYIDPSNFSYNTIRVVLNDSQFQNLIHEEISLTSTKGLVVKNLVDNLNFDIAEDEEVRFKYDGQGNSLLYHQGRLIETSKNRWYILPHMDGDIIVNSIRRAHTGNSSGTLYRGNMEISSNNQGIVLVNEVNLEEYLYSVVPSEMPVKFGLESLKVQAIAARAYGVRCFKSKGFAHLGGHVDDSTSSQVYNNIEENPIAIEAVDQTRGLIPVFEDQVIDARFFSTSYGYTANFHEVWSVNEVFPSIEVPYLIAKPQFLGDTTSLYNEENFKAFISNKDFEGYDHFSPFFRWNLSMTKEQLEAIIQQNIMPLQKNNPLLF